MSIGDEDQTVATRLTWSVPAHGCSVLTVHGDIDPPDAERMERLLASMVEGSDLIEIDIGAVGVFGSVALTAIETAGRIAHRRGVGLRVVNRPEHVQYVLDVFGFEPDVAPRDLAADDHGRRLIVSTDFDHIIAQGVLHGREAVVVTTTEMTAGGPEIVFVNRAFTDLTGYSADEVLGRTPRLLQGALTDRRTLDRLVDDVKHRRSFRGESVNYRQDGTPFVMSWRVVRVAGSPNHPDYLLGMQSDVTELRRLSKFETAITYLESQAEGMRAGDLDRDERDRRMLEVLLSAEVALMDGGYAIGRLMSAEGDTIYASTRSERVHDDARRLLDAAGSRRRVGAGADDSMLHVPIRLRPNSTFIGGDIVMAGMHRDRLTLADARLHEQLASHASERAFS